jgi:H+/Na+-translocating ferredoxin:NAD+ oxidoreductase subunit C
MSLEAQSSALKIYPCIRCDECMYVCPVNLQPQQLHWYSQEINEELLEDYYLSSCNECGDCDSVCPSHIPLSDQFKQAKKHIQDRHNKREKAVENKQRYLDKLERKVRQEEEKIKNRQQRLSQEKENNLKNKQDVIAAAVNRVKQKRKDKNI